MPSLDTLSIDECSTAGLEFRNPTLNYFRKSLRKKPCISEEVRWKEEKANWSQNYNNNQKNTNIWMLKK